MIKVKRYLAIFMIALVVLGVTTRAFCYAGLLKNFLDREFIDIYNYRYQLVTTGNFHRGYYAFQIAHSR